MLRQMTNHYCSTFYWTDKYSPVVVPVVEAVVEAVVVAVVVVSGSRYIQNGTHCFKHFVLKCAFLHNIMPQLVTIPEYFDWYIKVLVEFITVPVTTGLLR